MTTAKKRKGSVYLMVIAIFLFVSLFSALTLQNMRQSIFETHIYGMKMKAYYLNRQASEAVVAVLLDRDNELLKNIPNPPNATMFHGNEEGKTVGRSEIRLVQEIHKYYGEDRRWVVVYITTILPDERASRQGKDYTYEGTMMILVENPLIQLYNIDPETL